MYFRQMPYGLETLAIESGEVNIQRMIRRGGVIGVPINWEANLQYSNILFAPSCNTHILVTNVF